MKKLNILIIILSLFLLVCSSSFAQNKLLEPGLSSEQMEKYAAKQLLILWKNGTNQSEKNAIIQQLSGTLLYRFLTMEIDFISFQSIKLRKAAQDKISQFPSISIAEENMPIPYTKKKDSKKRNNNLSSESQVNSNASMGKKPYYQSYAHWRHHNSILESREFYEQKEEVIVAIVSECNYFESSQLKGLFAKNKIERTGKPGIDDDANGWIDDETGIATISPPAKRPLYADHLALTIAKSANLAKKKESSLKGKLKFIPISSYRNSFADWYGRGLNSFTSSMLQAIDYAAYRGADILVTPALINNSELLFEAYKNFDGLLVVDKNHPYRLQTKNLLNANLPNMIYVGYESYGKKKFYWQDWGNDLFAFGDIGFPTGRKVNSYYGINYSVGFVAGTAINLLSANPHLKASQIKTILLGSVDQHSAYLKGAKSNGTLNASKAALGRSQGGFFLSSNIDRISQKGPSSRLYYGIAYDEDRDLLYIYGGSYKDDFWVWNGKDWKEIKQDRRWGKYPGNVSGCFMTYNSKRKTINLVDPYWKVWSWDGAKWKRTQSKAPDRMLDFESDNLIYDPSRDCLFVYSTNNVIGLWKYKNKKWTRNSSKNSKYPSFTNLTYNSNLKKIATLGQSNGYWDEYDDSPVSCDALLLFDGKQWERKKIKRLPGYSGILIYNKKENSYYRFGSINRHFESRYLYPGNDIWKINIDKITNVANNLPRITPETYYCEPQVFLKKYIWQEKKQKLLIVGTPKDNFGENGTTEYLGSFLSIWQYSGSISPTYIDNLVLPQSDYDGDGKANLALWNPVSAEYRIHDKEDVKTGKTGDHPVPGDYNGDGKIEFGVCRAASGYRKKDEHKFVLPHWDWLIEGKTTTFGKLEEIPVPHDYNGDGKTQIAVYDKGLARWSFHGQEESVFFGKGGDLPVPADYDGDGVINLATYSPMTATWQIQGLGEVSLGEPGDSPVSADFNGDGCAEIGTWNPRKRLWQVMDLKSREIIISKTFGNKWDIPVPGDYNGDGRAQIATFSPFTGTWNIEGQPKVKFGTAGDVPLVRGN